MHRRTTARRLTAAAAGLLTIAAVSTVSTAPAAGAQPASRPGGQGRGPAQSVTIHLDPAGSDDNDGTAARPVRSLAGARQVLADPDNADTTSATILVRPGTYYESAVVHWSGIPQRTLAIRRAQDTGRPVFDGSRATGSSHYWMNTAGGPSLDVRGLLVRNYRTGGIRLDTDGNTVRNMIFERIGNKHVPDGPGYAALHLLGSSDNTFTNNVFRDLENVDCPGCVHAVYAANGSSRNRIDHSEFARITGDPVRLRHDTHDNVVAQSSFSRSGSPATHRAMVSFWRFTSAEVCGTGNRVDDNIYDGRYYDGGSGQQILGSGAEPGLDRCTSAVSGSGNRLVSRLPGR